jgi:hypothetical protein
MSLLKPSININPAYATNGLDNSQAGWYQVEPTTSNLALRISNTNIGMTGEIRLNTNQSPYIFQGNNGSTWVDFNATQGPQGEPGKDFTNAVNFNNLGASTDPSLVVSLGSIFATTFVDVSQDISNVNIRSLAGGSSIINNNLTVDSLVVSENSNVITLTSQPLPYQWDFSASNGRVSYLKNANSDTLNYGWGEVSNWTVKQGSSVYKGHAVRLDIETGTSNVVIVPITYNTLFLSTPYNTPMNMLGIAMEDANGGETCKVCTKGITTVYLSNDVNPLEFIPIVPSIGIDGILAKDGGIACPTSPPNVDYFTRAGYFLENGVSYGNYILFYVDPRVDSRV